MEPRRRLSDKIIEAHTQACNENKRDVAEALMRALEIDLSAIGGHPNADKRKSTALLEEAYARHERFKATQNP